MLESATIVRFDELPWLQPDGDKARRGLEGKRIIWGDAGFYVQHVSMPAGYVVEPHKHDKDELFLVLEGTCILDDGSQLGANDAAVLPANQPYGFRVGDEPLRFIVVRTAEATNQRVVADGPAET